MTDLDWSTRDGHPDLAHRDHSHDVGDGDDRADDDPSTQQSNDPQEAQDGDRTHHHEQHVATDEDINEVPGTSLLVYHRLHRVHSLRIAFDRFALIFRKIGVISVCFVEAFFEAGIHVPHCGGEFGAYSVIMRLEISPANDSIRALFLHT
jgi:hypothetical protein